MFTSDRILALNIGASRLALAEFRVKNGQAPELVQYGMAELLKLRDTYRAEYRREQAAERVARGDGIGGRIMVRFN